MRLRCSDRALTARTSLEGLGKERIGSHSLLRRGADTESLSGKVKIRHRPISSLIKCTCKMAPKWRRSHAHETEKAGTETWPNF
jgi:hypothetical protein